MEEKQTFAKHSKPSQAILALSFDCTMGKKALQNANVLRCTVISLNHICLLHSPLESAGSQPLSWHPESETFPSHQFSTTECSATVDWGHYIHTELH